MGDVKFMRCSWSAYGRRGEHLGVIGVDPNGEVAFRAHHHSINSDSLIAIAGMIDRIKADQVNSGHEE